MCVTWFARTSHSSFSSTRICSGLPTVGSGATSDHKDRAQQRDDEAETVHGNLRGGTGRREGRLRGRGPIQASRLRILAKDADCPFSRLRADTPEALPSSRRQSFSPSRKAATRRSRSLPLERRAWATQKPSRALRSNRLAIKMENRASVWTLRSPLHDSIT